MTPQDQDRPPLLGVVLVTFNSSDVILDCLESLLASTDVRLAIAVVDNASTDGTPDLLRRWAAGEESAPLAEVPFEVSAAPKPLTLGTGFGESAGGHRLCLVETGDNLGFAGGVNRGLEELAALEGCDRFWVLNPDSVAAPGTAHAFATASPDRPFSLMGGRVVYMDRPDMIQIDGGTVTRWSGITNNLNLYEDHDRTPPADPAEMDFITGASMLVSRQFYESAGPMREDYFLYYEEVDWAFRRGDLPLAYCAEALVYHHGGSAIGSATHARPASPFALYFKHRSRSLFVRRFLPGSRVSAHAWSLAKAAQYLRKGFVPEARALLAGALGLKPPRAVRERLSRTALRRLGA